MLSGHSKLRRLSVLLSHITGTRRSAGMPVASLAAAGMFPPAGRCLKYSPDQSSPLWCGTMAPGMLHSSQVLHGIPAAA